MSADNRTLIIVAWIGVVGTIVTALGAVGVAIVTNRETAQPAALSAPAHIEQTPTHIDQTPIHIDQAKDVQGPLSTSITGRWYDTSNGTYDIIQNGNEYSFTAYNADPSVRVNANGQGTIVDRRFRGTYTMSGTDGIRTNYSSGTFEGNLSADGRQIRGAMHDSLTGDHPALLFRQ